MAGTRRAWPLIVVAVVVVVVTGALAFSAGRLSVAAAQTPSGTSAEAGFARDMQVHHQQGVELAMIVRDRTDDEATRTLAYDIATTQAQQAGQLFATIAKDKDAPSAVRNRAMQIAGSLGVDVSAALGPQAQ